MASKKAGRLAGLAALAGLAYMANKKGETKDTGKSGTSAAETKVKDTAADDAKAAAKRNDYEETLDYTPSGNDAMYEKEPGFETKTTPAKVASVVKAPAAKAPAVKAPAAKPYVPFSSSPSIAPSGKNQTPNAASEAEQAKLMSSYKPRRPNTRLEDAELKDNTGKRIGRYEDDGGRSMAARQSPVTEDEGLKRGGKVKKMASGGTTSSASKRGDGIAQRGKTKGRVC